MRRRLADLALVRGGLVVAVATILYAWLAPAHIVDGDNAEFATLGAIGGAAHPSGYPLYVLWLRAWSWLPAGTPVHVASLATVILAGAQLAVLHAACRAWGARPLAATIAVGVFAASPFVMRNNVEAEVFALNGLVAAAVLWLAAAAGPVRGVARAALLGLVAGLGLANNLTCVLVAPIGIYGAVRGVREAGPRAVVAATVGLVLGLSPYLYLFIAPDNLQAWPRPHDLAGLIAIFTRQDYGGVGGFANFGTPVPVAAHLALWADTVGRTWLWAGALLGLGALAVRCVAPGGRESRGGWIALAISFAIAGPVLATRFNVGTDDFGAYIVRRFHILPALLLAPAVAVGLDALWTWLATRVTVRAGLAAGSALAVVGFLAAAAPALPTIAALHSPALEAGIDDLLRSLPPDAVVLGHGDTLATGALYVQLARGVRPDVAFIHWSSMGTPWYRARAAQQGVVLPPGADGPHAMIAQLIAAGRPVFVDPSLADLAAGMPRYPFGIVLRVLPPAAPVPPLADVIAINKQLFTGFHLDYPTPSIHDLHAAAMNARYAQLWSGLADDLAHAGKVDDAGWAQNLSRQLAPRP